MLRQPLDINRRSPAMPSLSELEAQAATRTVPAPEPTQSGAPPSPRDYAQANRPFFDSKRLASAPGLPQRQATGQAPSPTLANAAPRVGAQPPAAASTSVPSQLRKEASTPHLDSSDQWGAVDRFEVIASPAPLGRRVGAWIIDGVCIAGCVGALVWGTTSLVGLKRSVISALPTIALPLVALTALCAAVYGALCAFGWHGQTVGRRVLGLHLVDATGQPPQPLRAAARGILALASFAVFLGGFWLALFDRRGQTLHDKMTATFVVRLKAT